MTKALATRDEGRATPNFNLAGIKCIRPDEQWHQFFTTKESTNGGVTLVAVTGRQAANCFRAWTSLDEGARGWLATLATAYRETLPSLLAGNGTGWARVIGPSARPAAPGTPVPKRRPRAGATSRSWAP